MALNVLIVDETLGESDFVVSLLEELEQVGCASLRRHPRDINGDFQPDVLVLGASWLDWARNLRRRFPSCAIIGRGPWQGNAQGEFFPWGDQLREPSLPLTSLIPAEGMR